MQGLREQAAGIGGLVGLGQALGNPQGQQVPQPLVSGDAGQEIVAEPAIDEGRSVKLAGLEQLIGEFPGYRRFQGLGLGGGQGRFREGVGLGLWAIRGPVG